MLPTFLFDTTLELYSLTSMHDGRGNFLSPRFYEWLQIIEFLLGYPELERILSLHQAMLADMGPAERGKAPKCGGSLHVYHLKVEHERLGKLAQEMHPMSMGDTSWEWGTQMRETVEALVRDGHSFRSPRYSHPQEHDDPRDTPRPAWDCDPREIPKPGDLRALIRKDLEYRFRPPARTGRSLGTLWNLPSHSGSSRETSPDAQALARALDTPTHRTLQGALRRTLNAPGAPDLGTSLENSMDYAREISLTDSVLDTSAFDTSALASPALDASALASPALDTSALNVDAYQNSPALDASAPNTPVNRSRSRVNVSKARVKGPGKSVTQAVDKAAGKTTARARPFGRPPGAPTPTPLHDPLPDPRPGPTPDPAWVRAVKTVATVVVGALLGWYVIQPAADALVDAVTAAVRGR